MSRSLYESIAGGEGDCRDAADDETYQDIPEAIDDALQCSIASYGNRNISDR